MGISHMIGLNDSLTVFHLWAVAAIVLGFQLTALAWRIKREIVMARRGELTWIPVADYMTYISALILVVGVFIAPFFGDVPLRWTVWLFGLALVIFAATPPVIAGHYNLYRNKNECRPRVTTQEKWALVIVALAVGAYVLAGLIFLLQ